MTVSTSTNKAIFLGNGATTTFSFTFNMVDASYAVVTYTDSNGNQSVVAPGTYTLTFTTTGGALTYPMVGSPIANNTSLTLQRIVPYSQITTLSNVGALYPTVIEGMGDTLEYQIQQLAEQIARAILMNAADPIASGVLPPAAARINKVLGFDGAGAISLYAPGTVPASATASNITYTATGAGAVSRTVASKLGEAISIRDFGAVGDGVTDNSAAIQAAVTAALASTSVLYIPWSSAGYKVNTCINLTNLSAPLLIVGAGQNAPAFGLALTAPRSGSTILGNAGTGKPVFDCSGSNNVIFRDLNINCIGQSTPSTIGILFGTSTTALAAEAPGGSNCGCENVAIYMANANNSIPVAYVSGAGNSHFINLWTLGVYGVAISANNVLALSSPYVTFGAAIGIDGISAVGCNLLGYGAGQPLYIEGSNNHQWDQLYIVLIFGGAAYAGNPYAMYLNGCVDLRIKLECDYFPSVLEAGGTLNLVKLSGTTFPNATPLPVGVPIIAFFADFAVANSEFDVLPVSGALPNNNYHYTTTGGGAPTLTGFNNCQFLYYLPCSPNVFFGNCNNTFTAPFLNLRFIGNADAGIGAPIAMQKNGVAVVAANYRIFINGILYGTA
jgi:hypothetical protein